MEFKIIVHFQLPEYSVNKQTVFLVRYGIHSRTYIFHKIRYAGIKKIFPGGGGGGSNAYMQ